jgi:hypothetical protein
MKKMLGGTPMKITEFCITRGKFGGENTFYAKGPGKGGKEPAFPHSIVVEASYSIPCFSRYFSASRAAMQPEPAAVMACR